MFVNRDLLKQSLRRLSEYRREQKRFADSVATVLVLKRLGFAAGQTKPLTIPVFTQAAHELFSMSVTADHAASRTMCVNVLKVKPPIVVEEHWPRSTLWTRHGNNLWRGILAMTGSRWTLERNYVQAVLDKLDSKPIPAHAFASFILRRPSRLPGAPSFNTHEELLASMKSVLHLSEEEKALFDWVVPSDVVSLGNAELSDDEVMQTILEVETDSDTRRRLTWRASDAALPLIDQVLECASEMGQVLLVGPPGTGKTLLARQVAANLTGFGDDVEAAFSSDRAHLVAWHAGTTYEDFVRGVSVRKGTIRRRDGLFLRLCKKARDIDDRIVLVIDEFNRANPVAVLGDLMFGLERDKRGTPFTLADGKRVTVPPNIVILATANTADRSIAAVDAALGRRFARVEVPPQSSLLGDATVEGIGLRDVMDRVNENVAEQIDREHRVGHAYFMDQEGQALRTFNELVFALRFRIIPLLQDYAVDDFGVLEKLLGPAFLTSSRNDIDHGIFKDPEHLRRVLDQVPRSGI
jgi:hypothetical protein